MVYCPPILGLQQVVTQPSSAGFSSGWCQALNQGGKQFRKGLNFSFYHLSCVAPCGVQCAAGAKELQKLTMIYAAKLLQIAAKCVFHNSNY